MVNTVSTIALKLWYQKNRIIPFTYKKKKYILESLCLISFILICAFLWFIFNFNFILENKSTLFESQSLTANLFNQNINFIAIFHVELFGCLSFVESLSVKEESHVVGRQLYYFQIYTLFLAISIHQLFQLSCVLDFEEYFFTVLA